MSYFQRISTAGAVAGLALAMFWTARLAWADWWFRKGTPEAVARAVGIEPRNPEYLALHALQEEYDGGDATVDLLRAASLNPRASAPRIRLGLAAEVRGDREGAERWLLEAAAVDHQFEPRWTLANFYFRAGRTEEFWTWVRKGLEVSYGDRQPVFDLCRRVNPDAEVTLARAVPDAPEPTAEFLRFLLLHVRNDSDWNGVSKAALRLAGWRDGYGPLLLGACDGLLGAGKFDLAAGVWTALGEGAPAGVTHPDFEELRTGQGFDWRWIRTDGVSFAPVAGGLRIALSGREPEGVVLLRQPLGGMHGGRFRLRWQARTQGIAGASGFRWQVQGQAAPVAMSEDWTPGETNLSIKPGAWLEFVYQRPSGEARAEGFVELRRVTAEETPSTF